jgi:hypothetical protein
MRSPDVLAGRWVSAFSVLLLAVLAFWELRRGPARRSQNQSELIPKPRT